MPKEMDTSGRDLSPFPPGQKVNLWPGVFFMALMLFMWVWLFMGKDPGETPPPQAVYVGLTEPMPPPRPPQIRPPLPPEPLTDLHLLEQLNTTATEQLWTARAAVLIIGLGVLGIFTVSRRLKQLINRHDREIDLLMGIALGHQRDLLTQLGEGLAGHSRSPPWDEPPR